MIAITGFKGKKLALFGLGGSGLAAAKACAAGGADITVWDDRAEAVARAAAAGLKTGDLRQVDWGRVAALILSPGVPLTHPAPHWSAALAQAAGVEIIGDMELFARARRDFLQERQSARAGAQHKRAGALCPLIAITGTNGKSTTTALIAHLLRAAGYDVQMGGNIGKPILELGAFKPAAKQAYVVEVSSYQIDLAPSFAPNIGVLLNITPDHIDRHGSFADYAALKERLAAQSQKAIIVCGDALCRAVYARLKKAGKNPIAIKANGKNGYYAESAAYGWRLGEFWGEEGALLRAAKILHSRHNAQNALCALAACRTLGAEGFEKGLRDFSGLPHRLEAAGEAKYRGVKIRFINDSKATNAEAAAPALQSFHNIYWLAGGRAKAGGIESLMTRAQTAHIRGCYFFGEAAAGFEKTARNFFPEITEIHLPRGISIMGAALHKALKNAQADIAAGKIRKEAVILLSPACASFDQFKNFEERGKAFTELAAQAVKEMEKQNG